jgi:hypothetical protein
LTPDDVAACRTALTAPAQAEETRNFPYPLDFLHRSAFFKGGHTLPAATVVAGTYTVSVTCGGETVTGSFTVERFEPLEDFESAITFADGCAGDAGDRSVIVTVANNSPTHAAVVAAPGALMDGNLSLFATGPEGSCSTLFPQTETDQMPHLGPLHVDRLPRIPHVELTGAEPRSWSQCLSAALATCGQSDPSSAEVSATLHVLFRNRASPDVYVGPMRVPVKGKTP